jgi:hypothetical protein
MESDLNVFKNFIMAPSILDNGGGKYSRLCSRCFMEITPILIESDDDTISPLSRNSGTGDGLLLASRRRKRVFESEKEASNGIDEARIDGQTANISSEYLRMDEDTKDLDDDEATSDDLPEGTDFPSMSFKQVALILEEKIRDLGLPKEGKLGTTAILAAISFLQSKHSPKKVVKSNRPHPQPGDEIKWLLRGLGKDPGDRQKRRNMEKVLEEDRHPWNASKKRKSDEAVLVQDSPPAPNIYMRVWDDKSQARIREGNEGFLSGCNYMPPHTKEQHKSAIESHADWRNRQKTAFISATTDIEDIATNLVPCLERRQQRNGLSSITKITLINGNADGMPILPIRKELDFYKCDIPYENTQTNLKRIERIDKRRKEGKKMPKKMVRMSWFATEFLFLFRIPTNQIVKTWLWKDVEQWLTDNKTEDIQRWYQEVLVPAYNRHEHNRTSGSVEGAHEPNCTCCGH